MLVVILTCLLSWRKFKTKRFQVRLLWTVVIGMMVAGIVLASSSIVPILEIPGESEQTIRVYPPSAFPFTLQQHRDYNNDMFHYEIVAGWPDGLTIYETTPMDDQSFFILLDHFQTTVVLGLYVISGLILAFPVILAYQGLRKRSLIRTIVVRKMSIVRDRRVLGVLFMFILILTFGGIYWYSTATHHLYEEQVTGSPGLVILDVNLDAGHVSLVFEENENLLYRMEFDTPEDQILRYGPPVPTYVGNEIDLTYTETDVSVTLGTGVHYGINIDTSKYGAEVNISAIALVEYVNMNLENGTILFMLFDGVNVAGDMPVNLDIILGDIIINATVASNIGGSFDGATANGIFNIVEYDHWTQTGAHCETDSYNTASNTVTITADVSYQGDIHAFFNIPSPP